MAMPSFSVGSAQVEERLRIIRRRLNLFTLQDGLYLSGSLTLLAATLLIALALRGGASFFAVSAWTAAAAVVAAFVAAALRISRRWRSLEQVVRFADRQAGLDDRLATLMLDPSRARNSRLKDLLLEQILTVTPIWDVDALAPRRVPRSLYVLVGSLAALIATSFFVRPPAPPKPASAMRPHIGEHGADAVLVPRAEDTGGAGGGSAGAPIQVAKLEGVAGDGSQPPSSARSEGRHTDEQGSLAAAGQVGGNPIPGQQQLGEHRSGAAAQSAGAPPPGLTEKLQDAIRQALGAGDSGDDQHAEGHDGASRGARTGDAEQKNGEPTGKPGSDSLGKHAEGATAQPPSRSANMPGAGSAASPGARGGEPTSGLFGSGPNARPVGSESPELPIKLGALSTVAPSQGEPQRQVPPVGDSTDGTVSQHRSAGLADEQIADAPLQKPEVAPEHEALVRRIFTRDE